MRDKKILITIVCFMAINSACWSQSVITPPKKQTTSTTSTTSSATNKPRKKAAEGNLSAKQLYLKGVRLYSKNRDEEGFDLIYEAAVKGWPEAQDWVGTAYWNGEIDNDNKWHYGFGRNYKKAFEWYKKAAEGNDAGGMLNLGRAYLRGEGVAKDTVQAVKWLQKARKWGQRENADIELKKIPNKYK